MCSQSGSSDSSLPFLLHLVPLLRPSSRRLRHFHSLLRRSWSLATAALRRCGPADHEVCEDGRDHPTLRRIRSRLSSRGELIFFYYFISKFDAGLTTGTPPNAPTPYTRIAVDTKEQFSTRSFGVFLLPSMRMPHLQSKSRQTEFESPERLQCRCPRRRGCERTHQRSSLGR